MLMLRWIAQAVARSPLGFWLVRRAAAAPVRVKSPLFARLMAAVASRVERSPELILTNLGISDRMSVHIPYSKLSYVFGKPSDQLAEGATLKLAALLANRSAAFLDVGANDGLFTLTVANALGPHRYDVVHAFEPDPIIYSRLARNVAANCCEVRVNNLAVGSSAGRQVFYRNLDDDFSGSLTTHFAAKHRTVAVQTEVTTLAGYLVQHQLEDVCVKVDVEGAGLAVWSGARAAAQRISWLIMEIIRPEAEEGLPATIMSDTGWFAYYIKDFELMHSRSGEFSYVAPFYNWLFCEMDPGRLSELVISTGFTVTVSPIRMSQ